MFATFKKAWAILDQNEKRGIWLVLFITIVSGFMSGLMVGSVVPFLAVLADPGRIETSSFLSGLYAFGGFTGEYAFLIALGMTSFAIIVISGVLMLVRTYVVSRFTLMRVHSISRRLLSSYLEQPYEFFLQRNAGEMSAKILDETQQVVNKFLLPAAEAIAASITIFSVLTVLFLTDPTITISVFGVLGLSYGLVVIISRRFVKRLGQRRVKANKKRYLATGEALRGIKEVKLYNREAPFLEKFSRPSGNVARIQVKTRLLGQTPNYFMQVVVFGGIILLCLSLLDPETASGNGALAEILPILGVFAFAAQRLMPEMSKLYAAVIKLNSSGPAVETVFNDVVRLSRQETRVAQATQPIRLRQKLTMNGVSYTYPEAKQKGLSNVSVTIHAGETIGIVGGTGAGKTTFADLVLGLLSPQSGALEVDGTVISRKDVRAWRDSVSYVPQQIFLSDASIIENIAFGVDKKAIDQELVDRAVACAQLKDFIAQELPDGYTTSVGDSGVRLSGGQRQRIGIARALYSDADLIVLDEATSALDNLTEKKVMAAINALPNTKTIVMIAHRLSTVRNCDRIILMKSGEVDAVGSWEELIEKNEDFRALAATMENT